MILIFENDNCLGIDIKRVLTPGTIGVKIEIHQEKFWFEGGNNELCKAGLRGISRGKAIKGILTDDEVFSL